MFMVSRAIACSFLLFAPCLYGQDNSLERPASDFDSKGVGPTETLLKFSHQQLLRDVVVQLGNPANAISAISGGTYGNLLISPVDGSATAVQLNSNNGAAPIWTQTPAGLFLQGSAIAFSASGPLGSFNPTSLTFGAQNAGTTSAAQTTNFTNIGSSNLVVSQGYTSVDYFGTFIGTGYCATGYPITIPAGGSCPVSVTFTPTANGTRTGTFCARDNASDSPECMTLIGTGINVAPIPSCSPGSGNYGSTQTVTCTDPLASYTTSFPLTENPISESCRWTNGATNAAGCAIQSGIDWQNVETTPALAFGNWISGTVNDPTAVLLGPWGPNQSASGTVVCTGPNCPSNTTYAQEDEIRLRTTINGHSITGYEFDFWVGSTIGGVTKNYVIARWDGALNNYTYIARCLTGCTAVHNGDTLSATAIGCTLTGSINGTPVMTATDCTYPTGSPGIGFDNGDASKNSSFGFSYFTTSSTPVLCYTTNGAVPQTDRLFDCSVGTVYTSSLSVTATETLQIVAGGAGYADGPVATYSYVIGPPVPVAPILKMIITP